MEDFPFTTGIAVMFSRSMLVIDLTVLIAEIPCAPPSIAAMAGMHISVMLGVIFAMKGIFVVSATALEYARTKSGLEPTSEPIAWDVICGQEKLPSIKSTPTSSHIFASLRHSSSLEPMMDATIILSG